MLSLSMEFPREKNDSWRWRLSYSGLRLLKFVLGNRHALNVLLDSHWILRRLAFEEAGNVYGSTFQNQNLGIDQEWFLDQINPNDTILDIGCGSGRWANLASTKANNVIGIDTNEESLKIARSFGSTAKFEFFDVNRSLSELGKFTIGILVHVLEHIDDPEKLLNELLKVCDRLIIEVPDLEADPLNGIRLMRKRPYYSDSDHVREYSETTILTLLERTGWKPTSIRKRGAAIALIAVHPQN